MSINNINIIIDITSYFLAEFVNWDLQIHWPELTSKELDISEEIEQTILVGSTISDNGDIDRQFDIHSKTAWK